MKPNKVVNIKVYKATAKPSSTCSGFEPGTTKFTVLQDANRINVTEGLDNVSHLSVKPIVTSPVQIDQCGGLQRAHNSHSLTSGCNNGGLNKEHYEATMNNMSVHSPLLNCKNDNK